MKMPQLNKKCPSEAVVNSSYVCLVSAQHMCHTQKLKFCKNQVDKRMF